MEVLRHSHPLCRLLSRHPNQAEVLLCSPVFIPVHNQVVVLLLSLVLVRVHSRRHRHPADLRVLLPHNHHNSPQTDHLVSQVGNRALSHRLFRPPSPHQVLHRNRLSALLPNRLWVRHRIPQVSLLEDPLLSQVVLRLGNPPYSQALCLALSLVGVLLDSLH